MNIKEILQIGLYLYPCAHEFMAGGLVFWLSLSKFRLLHALAFSINKKIGQTPIVHAHSYYCKMGHYGLH